MKDYFKDLADGSYNMSPIAVVRSPFKNKYGVPKQPVLGGSIKGSIEFRNDPDLLTAIKELEGFSHLWVVFVFHAHGGKNWKPSIRPPRLGGRQKVGVLSSRSPHRPNPIGISVVKIEEFKILDDRNFDIIISGMDLVDGTPVLDIKPYLPYTDSFSDASTGWASAENKIYAVKFSEQALQFLQGLENADDIHQLIEQILELDPRPAYQQRENPIGDKASEGLAYGMKISDFEVKYSLQSDGILVTDISS